MADLTVRHRIVTDVRMPTFDSMMTFGCAVISMIGCGGCWLLSWIRLTTSVTNNDIMMII